MNNIGNYDPCLKTIQQHNWFRQSVNGKDVGKIKIRIQLNTAGEMYVYVYTHTCISEC